VGTPSPDIPSFFPSPRETHCVWIVSSFPCLDDEFVEMLTLCFPPSSRELFRHAITQTVTQGDTLHDSPDHQRLCASIQIFFSLSALLIRPIAVKMEAPSGTKESKVPGMSIPRRDPSVDDVLMGTLTMSGVEFE